MYKQISGFNNVIIYVVDFKKKESFQKKIWWFLIVFKDDYPQNSWLWSWLLKFQYLWPFAIELQNMGQKLSSIFLRTKNLCAISEWKWFCRSIICTWPFFLRGDEWGTINCTSSRKSYHRCSFPKKAVVRSAEHRWKFLCWCIKK